MDDVVQDCIVQFLELPEEERPQSREEYMRFATDTSRRICQRYATVARKFHSYDSPRHSTDGERVESAWKGVSRAQQETIVDVRRVLEAVRLMPDEKRRMAEKMIDGANVVESAAELKMTLYAAMGEQLSVRQILRRLMEEANESQPSGDRT